jgi:cullin-4
MVDHLLAFKALTEKTINESFHVAPEQIPRTNLVGSSTMINSSQKVIVDADATRAMHAAFTAAFKTRPLVPAERIARRIDKEMRSGQGKTSQKEYTARLKAILSLYRYSDDKDVFRIFYHRALAKRLLLGRSASDDEEKKMLKFLAKGMTKKVVLGTVTV